MTQMKGIKYKVGHERPQWQTFSYNYPKQNSYREQVIKILGDVLNNLKNENLPINDSITRFIFNEI